MIDHCIFPSNVALIPLLPFLKRILSPYATSQQNCGWFTRIPLPMYICFSNNFCSCSPGIDFGTMTSSKTYILSPAHTHVFGTGNSVILANIRAVPSFIRITIPPVSMGLKNWPSRCTIGEPSKKIGTRRSR